MISDDHKVEHAVLAIINDGDGSMCGLNYKQRCELAEYGLADYCQAVKKFDRTLTRTQNQQAGERIQEYYRNHVAEMNGDTKKATQITCDTITATFHLPLWVAEERFNWYEHHYFNQYHAYAGSYDRTTEHNHIDDALFKCGPYKELCIHPMSCWVTYKLPLHQDVATAIKKKAQEIERILTPWYDWQPKKEGEAP